MKDLRCSMNNCAYNKSYLCRAGRIGVTDEANCATYSPGRPKKDDNNVMFEAGMDGFSQTIQEPKVGCLAETCLFNSSEICTANGISVISENREAVCATFARK